MLVKLRSFFLCLLTLCCIHSFAQKKKTIKKYGIVSVTSTQTQGTKTLKEEKLTYNLSGQLIEEIKYNDEGELSTITRYKYNVDGEVIEETRYNEKNVLVEKRTIKYNALVQKTEERVTDNTGKQIKKFTYTYNAKGLRTEKKIYDANNVLVITKKIVYAYR